MEIEIQAKPLSINECWQGRRFKTSKYKSYEKEVLSLLPKKEKIKGFVRIDYIFGLKSLLRGDLGNLEKPLTDILVKKGYIEDDRFITKITLIKTLSKKFYINIFINKC